MISFKTLSHKACQFTNTGMQNTPASLGIIFIVGPLKSAVPLLEMNNCEPNYGQKSPELGGTAAGAYSGYFDQETGSERHDFRCAQRKPNEIDQCKSRSKHAFYQ